MAELKLYRTYRRSNDGKAPVVALMRQIFEDEGLLNSEGYREVSVLTGGVAAQTYKNLFDGDTKDPIERTVEATLSALGYKREIVRERDIDRSQELKKAAKWALQHVSSKARRRKTRNGHATRR